MSFKIKVEVSDSEGTKDIGIDITQNDKPFYSVSHQWVGTKEKDDARFNSIIGQLLGTVGITKAGEGIIGPIEEDEMIAFEIALTAASKALNVWAVEDAKLKGRDTSKSELALASL